MKNKEIIKHLKLLIKNLEKNPDKEFVGAVAFKTLHKGCWNGFAYEQGLDPWSKGRLVDLVASACDLRVDEIDAWDLGFCVEDVDVVLVLRDEE